MDESMKGTYQVAKEMLDAQAPNEEKERLRGIQDADVVVVRGQYDRVQDVLRILEIPHRKVQPAALDTLALEPGQLVIVNCPGQVSAAAVANVRGFVERGGTLFTTDWALKHVVEPAFPGTVAYNERPTLDEVVRVEIRDRSNPYLDGVFPAGADPVWWLEGSSYPIRVLDAGRVKVLLTSAELGARYGESPVAVQFAAGAGEVLHMISHYYLQRAETRTARHKESALAYAAEVGVDPGQMTKAVRDRLKFLKVGQIEAAFTSAKFMRSVVLKSRARSRGERKEQG